MTNSTNAPGTKRERSSADQDFDYFDQLSPALRFAVIETIGNFSSRDLYSYERRCHTLLVISDLRRTEENDVLRMAKHYQARYKMPYPHVAAGISIMRYGPLIPPRRKVRGYELRLQRKMERMYDNY